MTVKSCFLFVLSEDAVITKITLSNTHYSHKQKRVTGKKKKNPKICSPHHWPARSPDLSPLDYCVWGWMKELVYSEKLETRDALLGRILDAADHIRNSQLKLLCATRAVHNRAAACVAAGGGIFEN
jgi:hypothetical protein